MGVFTVLTDYLKNTFSKLNQYTILQLLWVDRGNRKILRNLYDKWIMKDLFIKGMAILAPEPDLLTLTP
ncbi:hypothetical protein [Petroclostridium xylanilyticum]|jgi:hypothetical protein|uniref:hypothetical protein n=1 Tax=Petroclostridium xylanilyticum TaxID=1792311 RepID=UPI000B98FD07|nr:hypothetical protein [Petroclostridium xylanilyticum]